MILTRRAASLALRPGITLRARLPPRRTYADIPGANKPARPTEIKNNTTLLMTGLAGVGLAACYFVLLAKPEVVGSEATGKPEKARDPKMARER
ncbi:hypothetical protein J3459_018334 [Metarhizium acridum]|nr:hypothetical protein J3459_018334 [Metarhizium acridum]